MFKAVKFVRIDGEKGQQCDYCPNLPTRILLFNDWTEGYCCERKNCLIDKAKLKKVSRDPLYRAWNPTWMKKDKIFSINTLQNYILKGGLNNED